MKFKEIRRENENMKIKIIRIRTRYLPLTLLVISILATYFFISNIGSKNESVAGVGSAYALAHPAFTQAANAELSFLEKEAGIALYLNAGKTIELSRAKAGYRSIEKEATNYIIGSIALPDLPESEDVHCLVHKDGWIVVYYLKGEPVAKIIDWKYWSGGRLANNKLQAGLEKMCNILGLPTTGAKYYHFQYPLANKLMIVIDTITGSGEDTFKIIIPKEIAVHEVSWSYYEEYAWGDSYFKIDGKIIDQMFNGRYETDYGFLSGGLSPDTTHIVSISSASAGREKDALGGVCIVLVYKEP